MLLYTVFYIKFMFGDKYAVLKYSFLSYHISTKIPLFYCLHNANSRLFYLRFSSLCIWTCTFGFQFMQNSVLFSFYFISFLRSLNKFSHHIPFTIIIERYTLTSRCTMWPSNRPNTLKGYNKSSQRNDRNRCKMVWTEFRLLYDIRS